MAGPIRIAILANAAQARRELNSTSSTFTKWADRAKRTAGLAVLAAGAAAVKVSADSIKAASESQQSIGATQQIYGKYADTVIRRSKEAATSIGVSANEYRELSNVAGAMLKSSGLPLKQVADLTGRLNKRAADLAATFGGTTKEAVEAVGSLLRGEADPIERYGVSIKQSDVNARLAAKGLDKLTGSALKQAEQQARLKLLFDQSADSAGQFAREADTLEGKKQRLSATIEDLKAKFGKLLIPAVSSAADVLDQRLLPAIEDGITWLRRNQDEIRSTAASVKDGLLPPLKAAGGVIADVTRFLANLPAPLQKAAVQAAALALVVPKVVTVLTALRTTATTSAASVVTLGQRLQQNRAAMTYQTGALNKAREAVSGFGGAARSVAGVGGMVALTAGATSSSDAMRTLSTVGGGALLGFSAGGPIGAAVGAGAGLIYSLATSADEASSSMAQAREPAVTFAESLDKITGAATQATRELALLRLEQLGALGPAAALGIEQRDLVGHLLGNADATRRVTRAMKGTSGEIQYTTDQYGNLTAIVPKTNANISALSSALGITQKELRKQGAATRETALSTERLSTVFKGLPKQAITQIKTEGIPRTRKEIGDLANRYELTPKQIRTVIQAVNAGASLKEIQRYVKGVEAGTNQASRSAEQGGRAVGDNLREGTSRARADLGGFQSSLAGAISSARSNASSGGTGIGNALGQGVQSGIGAYVGAVAGAAAGLVRSAVAAARREGQVRSPSRKTGYLGQMLGLGFIQGLASKRDQLAQQARAMVAAALTAARSDLSKVRGSVATLTDQRSRNSRPALNAFTEVTTEHRERASRAGEQRVIERVVERMPDNVRVYAPGLGEVVLRIAQDTARTEMDNDRRWRDEVGA